MSNSLVPIKPDVLSSLIGVLTVCKENQDLRLAGKVLAFFQQHIKLKGQWFPDVFGL